jgi:hypothetical protein
MPKKRKPVPRPKHRKPAPTAIVRVAAPVERPWELDSEQVTILKNAVAKGATDEELKYCLTVARRYRLDPFKRQIWFVSRYDRNATNATGGAGANVWTPQVGIDGLLFMSARDHKADFGSVSLPEYGPMIEVDWTNNGKQITYKAPEWAKVKVFKKGVEEPTEAIAYWEEYCPNDLSKAPFWRKMPRRMIGKCASALALRQAYPDLGGLYIPEETERMNQEFGQDYTPGGRLITVNGVTPSGQTVNTYGSHGAAQRILKEKLAGNGKSPQEAEIVDSGQPQSQRSGNKRQATLDWSNPQDPILTGDIQDLVPRAKAPYGLLKGLKVVWAADSLWHVALEAVKDLRQVCAEAGYDLTELHPKGSGPKKEAPVAAKTSAPASGAGAKPSATEPTLVSGTIERTNMGMAGKSPVKYVTLVKVDKTKPTLGCFHKSMWDEIEKGLGKFATFRVVTKGNYTNIEGLVKIGNREWLEDGTPAIQNNTREAGMKTLF